LKLTWHIAIVTDTKQEIKNFQAATLSHCYKVKVKVKVSLCFNWAPCHEGILGSEGIAAHILNLSTRGEWSALFVFMFPWAINSNEICCSYGTQWFFTVYTKGYLFSHVSHCLRFLAMDSWYKQMITAKKSEMHIYFALTMFWIYWTKA